MKLPWEMRFVDEMSLWNQFTLSNSQVLRVFWLFLISVLRFRTLSTIALLTYGQQVLKGGGMSCGRVGSSHVRNPAFGRGAHDTLYLSRATQLETGVSNKCLKHTLEFDSTAAVWPSRGCSLLQCHMQRQLWGRAPPGPDPHTTGSKFQILVGVLITNHQSFTPVLGIGGQKFLASKHAQGYSTSCTWCHQVLFQWSVLPQKKLPKTQRCFGRKWSNKIFSTGT